MDNVPLRIFEKPEPETWCTRFWERWGLVLIAPLLVISLFAFGAWYRAEAAESDSREVARLAGMHRAVAEAVYAQDLLTPNGSYIAAFPCGRFVQQEETSDLWAVSIAMEWRGVGNNERRIGIATGIIRLLHNQSAFLVESLEVANPSGTDREFVERMLQKSRLADLTSAESFAK